MKTFGPGMPLRPVGPMTASPFSPFSPGGPYIKIQDVQGCHNILGT